MAGNTSNPKHILFYEKEELDRYLNKRKQLLSNKSLQWLDKANELFWLYSKEVVSEDTLTQYREFVLTHYSSFDSISKVFSFARSFIHEIGLKHDINTQFLLLILEVPKNLKKRSVNERIICDDDIVHLLSAISCSDLTIERKKEYEALILFLAYSGQRPVVAEKIQVKQITDALNRSPPILDIREDQDKTRTAHKVPLHPVLIPILKDLMNDKSPESNAFLKDRCVRWLRDQSISLTHIDDKIQLADLRKYFEQKSDNLGFIDAYKNLIMCHGLSGVSYKHYKQATPDQLYEKYIESWGDVILNSSASIVESEKTLDEISQLQDRLKYLQNCKSDLKRQYKEEYPAIREKRCFDRDIDRYEPTEEEILIWEKQRLEAQIKELEESCKEISEDLGY